MASNIVKITWGKVQKGQSRGKQIGFPTANLKLHKFISEGVYISIAKINDKFYQSLTFIGTARTFSETTKKAEIYLFSNNKNLYGNWMSVRLIKKIRQAKKFSSVKLLSQAIKKDKKIAVNFFKENK